MEQVKNNNKDEVSTSAFALSFKKYPVDAGLIILFLLCALLFAERPKAVSPTQSVSTSHRFPVSPTQAVPPAPRFPDSPIQPYKNLEARNIFDMDGNYEKPKELKIIPENPYNLIAVLEGKEKRAIFKEYTGSYVSFKKGDKMMDGAIIKDIGSLKVTVKKGKDLKEYRIFEIKKNKDKDKK
jgi:hypothetical protein